MNEFEWFIPGKEFTVENIPDIFVKCVVVFFPGAADTDSEKEVRTGDSVRIGDGEGIDSSDIESQLTILFFISQQCRG